MNTPKHNHRPAALIPPPGAPPLLDASLDSASRRRLEALFRQGWDDLAAGVHFTSARAAPGGSRTVAFVDGPLTAEHAALLRREVPVLLCARREEEGFPSEWEIKLALSLIGGRVLGPSTIQWRRGKVGSLRELEQAAELMGRFATDAGGSSATAQIVTDVAHELLANALLDAPVNAAGEPKYAHQRDKRPEIAPEDSCRIAIGSAESRIFISVTDRFGRLTEGPLVRAVEGLGRPLQLDTTGGGAGLGFRRLVDNSDALAVRVAPGRMTEVMSVVELAGARRRSAAPKSIFFVRSAPRASRDR